ncbi:hypothetical protein ACLBXM_06200 [Xanthobacteraceae bacterium A53D]
MSRQNQTWRYLTALGVAYLLVFQLLLIGVSAGSRITLDPTSDQAILCLGAKTDAESSGDQHELPPCCSIACPMVGGLGAPPLPPSDASLVDFVHLAPVLPPTVAASLSQHDAAPFRARGPPVFA